MDKYKNCKAYIEVKSQKPVGKFPRRGPDTYVIVQIVPDNKPKLQVLNKTHASKRNIRMIYCGEGYSNRCTHPNSMLNIAIRKAKILAHRVNNAEEYNNKFSFTIKKQKGLTYVC